MDFRDLKEFIKDTFSYIMVIVIVILIFIYVISIQQVVGPSMNGTLSAGDVIIINKFVYRFDDIARGDVIVFEHEGLKNLVKRVIGLPGEYIEYNDNTLLVNGVGYKEPYIKNGIITDNFNLKDIGYEQIPEGYYLVLGDNRPDSMDSRDIGLISKEQIIGKVGLRIYPFNAFKLVR